MRNSFKASASGCDNNDAATLKRFLKVDLSKIYSNKTDPAVAEWLRAGNVDSVGNERGIVVAPKAEGSALNTFAHRMKHKFNVDVVYNPARLDGATGGYHRESKTLYLSHEALLTLENGPVEEHEAFHAEAHQALLQGKIAPAHIRLYPTGQKGNFSTESPNGITAEEFVGYPLVMDQTKEAGVFLRMLNQAEPYFRRGLAELDTIDLKKYVAVDEGIFSLVVPIEEIRLDIPLFNRAQVPDVVAAAKGKYPDRPAEDAFELSGILQRNLLCDVKYC